MGLSHSSAWNNRSVFRRADIHAAANCSAGMMSARIGEVTRFRLSTLQALGNVTSPHLAQVASIRRGVKVHRLFAGRSSP